MQRVEILRPILLDSFVFLFFKTNHSNPCPREPISNTAGLGQDLCEVDQTVGAHL